MKNDFSWYLNALKGVRGPITADDPEPGFYESRFKNRDTGKVTRSIVAYWYDSNDGGLRCHKNGRDVDDLAAREMWPYASKYPITEETYHAVRAGKPWPDVDGAADSAAEDDGTKSEAEKLVEKIKAAKANVPLYAKIDSDELSAKAQSLRSELTGLAGRLDKEREALVRPHIDAQRAINGAWNPHINDAKDQATLIRKAQEKWEDDKREAARRAQAAIDREIEEARRKHDATVAKAAAEGKEPPSEYPLIPSGPAPQSNMPAPSTQIRGGTGRAASVSVYHEAEITDQDAVYQHFKTDAALKNLLLQLAQSATNAGIKVPGVVTHERSKVR